jgi:antirestriction protein ArdC
MSDIYQKITDQIIAAIEAGAGNFVMPWHRPKSNGMPYNPARKGGYKGCNVLALWLAEQYRGYTTSNWATYKQWATLGAQVKKGEKATSVVFYKPLEVADRNKPEVEDADPTKTIVLAREYHVFNADQVDNWTPPEMVKPIVANPAAPLPHVDLFVKNTGADVRTGEPRAYYVPSRDFINMPDRSLFTGSPTSTPTETYYSTLLHELSHWTGAPNRLNRDKMGARFGNEQYAAEELVAELGAAFLCAELGIANDPRPDHAQYIQNWLTVLKNDPRAIFVAASKAQAVVTYLDGLQGERESVAA